MVGKSLKKLSQSTAVAALGVAMVAAVGTAPASAQTLERWELNVNFGTTATATGYYILDADQFPLQSSSGFGVSLAEWDVSVIENNSGNVLDRFFNSFIGNTALANTLHFAGVYQPGTILDGQPIEALNFTNTRPFKQLTLQFPTGFTGYVNTPIADYLNSTGAGISTSVTGGGATSVPEPFTMTATAVAGAMGLWMKRKQKASISA